MSLSNPKISDHETAKILNHFFPGDLPPVVVLAVRGYFVNSYGKPGENDLNVWDDAMMVCDGGKLVKAFNANTDPSKVNSNLAMLDTGIYRFYRGTHKNRIKAFRAYPEGVRLKCKRQDARGRWFDAFCSAINIHDGGERDTWSAGCQTLPNFKGNFQFNEFRDLVYDLMDKHDAKTMTYLLINEKQMQAILNASQNDHLILEIPHDSTVAPAAIPPQGITFESSDAPDSNALANANGLENRDDPANAKPPSILENLEDKAGQLTGKISETIEQTKKTAEGEIKKTTESVTDTFNPLNLPAFIPRFGKRWLAALFPTGFSIATIIAAIQDAPQLLVFFLGFMSGVAAFGFILLVVKHWEKVEEFIKGCYEATADPQMHNLIPTKAGGFVGFRNATLLSAFAAPPRSKK